MQKKSFNQCCCISCLFILFYAEFREVFNPSLPSKLVVNDPFDPEHYFHILDTTSDYSEVVPLLNQEVFVRKVQLQYVNALEDESSDYPPFVPMEVLDHRLAFQTRQKLQQNHLLLHLLLRLLRANISDYIHIGKMALSHGRM